MKSHSGRRGASPDPSGAARLAVCASLCRYYHPEKTEETGCAGVHWLARRLDAGALSALLSLPDTADPLFGLDPDDGRLQEVCADCSYLVGGCDFRDPDVPRASCAPCGGLRAAARVFAAPEP